MVMLYSRAQCAPCQTLKLFFNRKGITYKELPIEQSEYRVAPTVVIGRHVITGPNLRLISQLLAK